MKRLCYLIIVFGFLTLAPAAVSASGALSPGLQQIAYENEMIASGLIGAGIRFSSADFENAVGKSLDSVTITSLPSAADGTLFFGDAPVKAGQEIRMKSVSSLRFEPTKACKTSSFRFRADEGYSFPCILRWTDHANAAPSASVSGDAVACWTQKDISVYGSMPGYDPDGDSILFEVVEYPDHGLLEVLSPSSGDYRYTPFDGVQGSDSFTYTVRDEWGHYSEPQTVSISVVKAASTLELADMEGHWAHNAALVMASENAMDVRYVNGEIYFDPDAAITREDFLTTVMKALGAGDIAPAKTVFDDDGEISDSASGYVARAYSLGIVRGSNEDGKLCFRPKDCVTRAEAAVILNKIVGAEDSDAIAVFADSSSVPAWARSSLSALTAAGVLGGTGAGQISPNSILSRGEAAEMIFKVQRIYG